MSGPAHSNDHSSEDPPAAETPLVREVAIVNKKGLHARASAKFVQMAEQFDASISVARGGETVGGTSIMGLMMLSASPGSTITITATGRQAAAAIEALCGLIASGFGEDD
jgi:phosphocarrier protein HPr